jgi:uncharacterized coiled-coil protein SlyX
MEKTKNQKMNEEVMHPKHNYRNDNDVRIAIVENTIGHINETLIRMEKRFDKIDEKLETMDKKIDSINNRMWTNFLWLLGVMSAFSVGLLGIIAKGFHWIGG